MSDTEADFMERPCHCQPYGSECRYCEAYREWDEYACVWAVPSNARYTDGTVVYDRCGESIAGTITITEADGSDPETSRVCEGCAQRAYQELDDEFNISFAPLELG